MSAVRACFQIVRGIGPVREKRMRARGVADWGAFAADPERAGLDRTLTARLLAAIASAEDAFRRRDLAHLDSLLPRAECWRLYADFPEEAAFLDIETTGLEAVAAVTVIGLFYRGGYRSFVLDVNLHEFAEAIPEPKLLVTFNGALFDLPFIRRALGIAIATPHVDLRYVLRRAGFSGGLKKIEKDLGFARADEIADIDGLEAVRLWHQWCSGSPAALEKLVRYNRADVENLPALAEKAVAVLGAAGTT